DTIDWDCHQRTSGVHPPRTNQRAGHRNEELRQDPARLGVRGRPAPGYGGSLGPTVNVRCPTCETVYRVDPAKVGDAGVRARCAVCSTIIPVTKAAAQAAAPPVAAAAPAPGAPTRPSAPVFRPAPSRPAQPAVAAQPPAPAATPPPPAAAAPRASAGSPTGGVKPLNPFMAQDPRQKARRLARALVSDMIV